MKFPYGKYGIYTAGYGYRNARAIVLTARELDALVLDIRLQPSSRIPGWSQKDLIAALGARYCHIPALGNANLGTGKPPALVDAEKGLEQVLRYSTTRTLLLLCGCPRPEKCHRTLVAQMLQDRGAITTEWEWPEVDEPDITNWPDAVLSVKQPWAWLLAHGEKDVENRTWGHPHRGPFLIHASKSFDVEGHHTIIHNMPEIARHMPRVDDFDKGGIVGQANVVRVIDSRRDVRYTDPAFSSRWYCGPVGFVVNNAKTLPFLPLQGDRGFFSLRDQLKKMAERSNSSGGVVHAA